MNRKMRLPNQKTTVLLVATLVIASVTAYAVQQIIPVKPQTTQASSLGQSIQDLTQGIIGRTNQQVQNTLENAGQQALPQLVSNASQYDCIVVIMHFGKASGAMTCSPEDRFTAPITVNSQNAPSGSGSGSSILVVFTVKITFYVNKRFVSLIINFILLEKDNIT